METSELTAKLEQLESRIDHFKLYDFFPIAVDYRAAAKGQFDKDYVPVELRELDHLLNPVSKARPGEELPKLVDPGDHYLGSSPTCVELSLGIQ